MIKTTNNQQRMLFKTKPNKANFKTKVRGQKPALSQVEGTEVRNQSSLLGPQGDGFAARAGRDTVEKKLKIAEKIAGKMLKCRE